MAEPERRLPMCRHFRYKPFRLAGMEVAIDPADGPLVAHCWCVLTQREFGPDDQPVHLDDCRPGRACCVRL